MNQNLSSDKAQAARLAQRKADLLEKDRQYRDAMPDEALTKAKSRPGLRLAQVMATVMEGYSERPALGHRAFEIVIDAATGRRTRRLLPSFTTITYRELWSRARALASVWHSEAGIQVAAGDSVAVLAFAGADYVVVDLAAIHLGAVVVPLQTNAATATLVQIVEEVEPRCLAASMDSLGLAVDVILGGYKPASLIVLDYVPEDDTHKEHFRRALERLAEADCPTILLTLGDLCEKGRSLPPAPLYVGKEGEDPLATIYYTSGSTGSPKGAMYRERMTLGPWLVPHPTPVIVVHYMPMNHSFGRSTVFMALGNGGTCYFAAKSDLSTYFEDIRLVRPTQNSFVPRVCEMLFQRYRADVERRQEAGTDRPMAERLALVETRDDALGGRMVAATFGSAPLSPELRNFMEACLDITMQDGYGTTETAAIAINSRILRPPVIDYKLEDVPELGYFRTDKPHPRGELLVKTANIMAGYYKRPELTATMFDAEGYYRTGDIMAEIGPDQIVYVDRRNNVLKLSQGEFVAIAQLEATFAGGNPLIRQIFLYGTSERAFLLAVIVPNASLIPAHVAKEGPAAVKSLLREVIKEIARKEQLNAYEVPRDFLIEDEPFSVENGLLAGVGKVLRPALKARYGPRLEQLYAEIADSQASELSALRREGGNAPVIQTVIRALQATLGVENVDAAGRHSFEEMGGDSLSALAYSLLLEEIYGLEVPVGVITNPASNLRQLAAYIEKTRTSGKPRPTFATVHGRSANEIRASDLTLDKFIDASTLAAARDLPRVEGDPKIVLLTGANGYLGRFLCLEWLERFARTGGRLVCIARGQDAASARERIVDSFDSGDAGLVQHVATLADNHLEVLAGDLGEANLGLSDEEWNRLALAVDLIVHPAAYVNHILPYQQLFGPNVVGTAELIRLAITKRLKPFVNVSTVAAALADDGTCLSEDDDVRVASPVRALDSKGYASGYATSKWAGEVLLAEAHDRLGLPVAVFRSDMILAHSRYAGQLNVPDMFTRWLYSLVVTGLAPRSFYQPAVGKRPHYDGLPVDFTAEAITTLGAGLRTGYRTYHVLNPHDDGISLDQFVDWIVAAGHPIQRVDDYGDWFGRFETALKALPEKQRSRSSLPLLHQLRRPAPLSTGVPAERFRTAVRVHGIGADKDIPHLSADFIRKYLHDLKVLALI